MSSKSNKTGAEEHRSRRKKQPVDLTTARRMLPLVQRIVTDIVRDAEQLNKYTFEQEGLDRNRSNLTWPERQRRYTVQGEVSRLQTRLDEESRELDSLGAVLTNPALGYVGFPTVVNGRPAYFSWQPGEESVNFWQFDGESTRRPIPPNWQETVPIRAVSQR
jgi:hypothetical protein